MGKTGEDYKNEVVTYAKILDEKGLVNTVEEISLFLTEKRANFMLPRPVHASAFLMRTR